MYRSSRKEAVLKYFKRTEHKYINNNNKNNNNNNNKNNNNNNNNNNNIFNKTTALKLFSTSSVAFVSLAFCCYLIFDFLELFLEDVLLFLLLLDVFVLCFFGDF